MWTCRNGEFLKSALQYLKDNDMLQLFEEVNKNVPEMFDTSSKIFANYYIDDLNLGGFPGWVKVKEIIMQDKYFERRE